jgi:glutamyl-tRNA synthetase
MKNIELKNLTDFDKFIGMMKESVSGSVRTRFAPSPTGPLHIGGVRTALYNYLFAKKYDGVFYLRIEDTDQGRFVPGAEDYIRKSLEWAGIEPEESPWQGGPYGPYRQSERGDIYPKYAKQLVDDGKAYYCFDTPDDIEAMKSRLLEKGIQSPQYDHKTRMEMKNSLALPPEQVEKLLADKVPFVVRIKFPAGEQIVVNDIIRGTITVNTDTLDDKVLFKSDGLPTYHLANIVDDHLMKTTHVIRGEEWLPSAPLHVFLYKSLGWEAPEFAHLALLLAPGGNGKLSKRDGDKYGFPVFPLEWKDPKDPTKSSTGYKNTGYFPEAFINFLAFLGWNPGTEQEIMSMDELAKAFSLERCGKAGAKFNVDKAQWYNGQYLKQKSDEEVVEALKPMLVERGINLPDRTIKKMVEMNKGKANFIKDIYDASLYLFEKPTTYDKKVAEKKWTEKSPQIISDIKDVFTAVNDWKSETIQKAFEDYVNASGLKFGDIAPSLRLVLTGMGFGPSLFDIMEIVGKEATLDRMTNYVVKGKKVKPASTEPPAPEGV